MARLLCADLLQKLLLIYRPYEERRGDTEAVYEDRWPTCAGRWKSTPVEPGVQLRALRDSHSALPRPLPQAGGSAATGACR